MTPRLLRFFVVLASELRFGRAAERLLIAQSAPSRNVEELLTGQVGAPSSFRPWAQRT